MLKLNASYSKKVPTDEKFSSESSRAKHTTGRRRRSGPVRRSASYARARQIGRFGRI